MKDDLRYDALRDADTRSETSNTEVEDWDKEDAMKPRRRRTCWSRFKPWKWLLDTTLLLIILALLIERQWAHHRHHPSQTFELAGDITGFAPKFSQQITAFKPDLGFAPENASEFWGAETQQKWLDIVPGTPYPILTYASQN